MDNDVRDATLMGIAALTAFLDARRISTIGISSCFAGTSRTADRMQFSWRMPACSTSARCSWRRQLLVKESHPKSCSRSSLLRWSKDET